MNVKIRKATREDFETLLDLSLGLFKYEKKFGKTFNMNWTYSPRGRSFFASRIESGVVVVAEVGGKVVGYAAGYIDTYSYRSINPIVELENMFVYEKFRNKGVGGKILEEFKKISKKEGAKRIKIGALSQNSEAISFYKRSGLDEFETVLEGDL